MLGINKIISIVQVDIRDTSSNFLDKVSVIVINFSQGAATELSVKSEAPKISQS